jgi:hypothetical protein
LTGQADQEISVRRLEGDLAGGLLRPRVSVVWRWRLRLIAAPVAIFLALLLGPSWFNAVISFLWSDLWMRYRIIQGVFLSFQFALIVVPIALVGAAAVGLHARRRRQYRLATWAGRSFLLCLSLLIGLALCEVASVWRLHSEAKLVHPLDKVGAATKAASGAKKSIVDLPGRIASANLAGEPIRVVIIGGSSAKGFPFAPKMSLDRVIAWQLGRAFPGREVVADNRADLGLNLEQAIGRLIGLEHRPDLLIVYSGHNEFQSRFGLLRSIPYYRDESKVGPATFAQMASKWTSTADLLGRDLDRLEAAIIPRLINREIAPADSPAFTQDQYAIVLSDYRRRLDGLLSDCEAAGILTLVILPPSNVGIFDPNRSILPPETTLAERKSFVGKLDEIKHNEEFDPVRAIAGYRQLIAEQPGFAETHFRLARMLQAVGSFDEAREEYVRARDLDAFPTRCPTPFLGVCREVGRRHGSIVMDAPRLLALACPNGILDDHMFDDVHHPGLNAVVLMAREAIRQLKARSAFDWPVNVAAPKFTMADCIDRFGLDQAVWINVCKNASDYYDITSRERHDPSWRKAVSSRYGRAMKLLEAGKRPDETGVPGFRIRDELTAELPPD